jgi:glycosyltransferase involved in cell wall biosynthesis
MDGGSTDATLEILSAYQKAYNHIRVISQADNGQSQAMNSGIHEAKHDLIGFLNVDDSYMADTLNIVTTIALRAPSYSFIVGNCLLVSSSGKSLSINKPSSLNFFCLLLSTRIFPYPSNPSAYFYDRRLHDLVGYYTEDFHYTMDLEFILRMSKVANVIKIDSILGTFTLHSGSKTIRNRQQSSIERLKWQSKYVHQLDPLTFVLYKVLRLFVLCHEAFYQARVLSGRAFSRLRYLLVT